MKNKQLRIENEIDQTLQAIDNIDRATPKPFFLTRVQARLDARTALKTRTVWAFRPAYVVASLGVVLLLNLLAVVYIAERVTRHEQARESAGLAAELGIEPSALAW